MHATFTGNPRRLRQVDLSGRRTTNPWASVGSSNATSGNAVLAAQQQRQERAHQQKRLAATQLYQRSWRGIQTRKTCREAWRQEWTSVEQRYGADPSRLPYGDRDELFHQVKLLLQFFNINIRHDVERLRLLLSREEATLATSSSPDLDSSYAYCLLRLQRLLLSVLVSQSSLRQPIIDTQWLQHLTINLRIITPSNLSDVKALYRLLASLLHTISTKEPLDTGAFNLVMQCVASPLAQRGSIVDYEAFASEILVSPILKTPPLYPKALDVLAPVVNSQALASAVVDMKASGRLEQPQELKTANEHAFVLAYMLYFRERARSPKSQSAGTADGNFMSAVSYLLSSMTAARSMLAAQKHDEDNQKTTIPDGKAMDDPFVQKLVLSMIDDQTVLSSFSLSTTESSSSAGDQHANYQVKQLASFALVLLRIFPEKADDVRFKLYYGSSSLPSAESTFKTSSIQYFWQAAKTTSVFRTICQNLHQSVPLLLADKENPLNLKRLTNIQEEWTVILVFLELFIFVMRVMDDEEFLSKAVPAIDGASRTLASHNALPLSDIKSLTSFLKNLSLEMFRQAQTLAGVHEASLAEPVSLQEYFNPSRRNSSGRARSNDSPEEPTIAGMNGLTIDYAKTLVTTLQRMIYERDSRRRFLPDDHWLMTSHLQMNGFVSSVIADDEKRRTFQQDEEDDELSDEEQPLQNDRDSVIGASQAKRLRQQQRLRKQQNRLARKRTLAIATPHLEIMQHMPFFIPFEERVKIFRKFVELDQRKRRGGDFDADQWRMMSWANPDMLRRHQATIRRDHVFRDAFNQYWPLGEGLKEPIQITFVDAYGSEEAGIDGGGVTKEFLTSIIHETFQPSDEEREKIRVPLFSENHEHKLYPNPTALDEAYEARKRTTNAYGLSTFESLEQSQEHDPLKDYEFIGRIIGKCLYEGILVDVSFAGFFLLKWALADGDGAASQRTAYRANFNELRDLDEELYRGLLQLKNYSGDVTDFGLDFTINDQIIYDHRTGAHITKTTNLSPDGANEAVTNANRLRYIQSVAAYRLRIQPSRQTAAFLRGLSAMIKPRWLNMFNQIELQTLVGGTSDSIDVADLRENTECSGVFQPGDIGEHRTIKLFWEVMNEFDDEQRRAVIKFVTSTPRAPLLGFKTLSPRFTIRDSGADQTRLPSTSTCVNLLKLPMYTSKKVLKQKLLQAVFAGAGFDLS